MESEYNIPLTLAIGKAFSFLLLLHRSLRFLLLVPFGFWCYRADVETWFASWWSFRYHSTENLRGESLAIGGQWHHSSGIADTCPRDVHADFRHHVARFYQMVADGNLEKGAAVLEEACGAHFQAAASNSARCTMPVSLV